MKMVTKRKGETGPGVERRTVGSDKNEERLTTGWEGRNDDKRRREGVRE